MDVYDELLASYDPIDYMYTIFEKPNPNEEERKKMFFLNKDLFDDSLTREAQAGYFSHARKFMQTTVFQSVVKVG